MRKCHEKSGFWQYRARGLGTIIGLGPSIKESGFSMELEGDLMLWGGRAIIVLGTQVERGF